MQCILFNSLPTNLTSHARRLAKQYRHGHIHRHIPELTIGKLQMQCFRCFADDGERTAFALANRFKTRQIFWLHRHHITLLRFVTPNLSRRHARFIIWHSTQLKAPATATVLHQFGKGIGQSTGAHIMNKGNGVVLAQLPATVDNLLTTALHLRVLPLHRSKIKICVALSARHG